ncbi:helix-turn-helix domain-containing protein [Brevundimonas nasdae]|uniref:Helix-turn-helix domain-containing protein n=1 Tax=Brevundimonas nasdae TaxID=172043 RepID=A0ABX8TJT7_9CAUL|nr:helix-turn-helix transcriptional regulator [Brevundimonas nasdae]QYC11483.1 helix-turn-helix domain-containing protein [Brevundimonas nasdae]QYC14271.1 helix-turn-helix domain-containing protein [Brevundimonas nasdae]
MSEDPDPVDVQLGGAIRMRREALNLSQAALGGQIGVTFQQVQKYERGVNRVSASRLLQIAAVLEIPASELLGERSDDNKPGAATLLAWYNQIETEEHRAALLALAKALRPVTAA